MNRRRTEDVYGGETILYVSVVGTCHYTFVQTPRTYDT